MKAFEDGKPVALELIELDDMGWDRADTRGDREIALELSVPDLQVIGNYPYQMNTKVSRQRA